VLLTLEQGVQPRADLEAAFGQLDGRREQLGPGKPAVLLVRHLQHANRAGRADRTAADHAIVESHRLAVGADKEFFIGRRRCGFAAVKGLDLAAAGMQQEGTAAYAAGLRLHQREHHLHGNRRVHGRTAGLEHLVAGIGGQGVGSRHGEFFGGPTRLGREAR